jgi:poly-gamma-glutamate synthesis protein (capsule biosynthesis protein)
MQVIIAGDLVPTQSNMALFNNAEVETLLGEKLFALWNLADFRIFNLETPLADEKNPINKWGSNLIAPTSAFNGIKALKPSLITMANNHIFDQGVNGLESTEKLLDLHAIPYIGSGANLDQAQRPHIIKKEGLRIGIYACAEHEFSIADEKNPGANPFDPLESLDHIQQLKNECDCVLVLYHGGKEHYRYPSPGLQKVTRKMVDKGADLVICQHSHCIGCSETYHGATIIYGQGNFIFDDSDSEFWQTSLLVKAEMKETLRIEYLPVIKKGKVIQLAEGEQASKIMEGFSERSRQISDENFVKQEYQKLAEKYMVSYLTKLSGRGKWLSRIDRRIFSNALIKRKYNNEKLLAVQNYLDCEAHRELILAGLNNNREK